MRLPLCPGLPQARGDCERVWYVAYVESAKHRDAQPAQLIDAAAEWSRLSRGDEATSRSRLLYGTPMPGTGPPVVVPQLSGRWVSGPQFAPATRRPEADRDIDWP